jgi:hypothetical protein
MRSCRVSVRDTVGVLHAVDVTAATLLEAAAQAVTMFEQEGWASDALTANAVLHVEVVLPPVVHHVPLKAVQKWRASPTTSPREQAIKRAIKSPGLERIDR